MNRLELHSYLTALASNQMQLVEGETSTALYWACNVVRALRGEQYTSDPAEHQRMFMEAQRLVRECEP